VKKVERKELLDYQTYRDGRDESRARILKLKEPRRIHVGRYLTFLFENADTIRYQVQEMMLVERMVREADIQHELDTYNELLGGDGELGATLLIEIEDINERDQKLRKWLDLPKHVYAKLGNGTKVRATYDKRQISDERLSAVHYVKFDVGGQVPAALGCDLPDLTAEAPLNAEQKRALEEDLRFTSGA
jgi:hypothetical protein